MSLVLLRTALRWIFILAILAVAVQAINEYRAVPAPPPVRLPGGDLTAPGVSPELARMFADFRNNDDPGEGLHFVVQFERDLTAGELQRIETSLRISLSGPFPEHAYLTSATEEAWDRVQDSLFSEEPVAVKMHEYRKIDRLHPRLRSGSGSAVRASPAAAEINDSQVGVFVRFHDDVTYADQFAILMGTDILATQTDGITPPESGPTGIWAVIMPSGNLENLSMKDEVRYIEPRMPTVEVDMDQAVLDVGAGDVDYDGADTVVAQWEQCPTSVLHPDLMGRVAPANPPSILCREWVYAEETGNNNYDLTEPIGVDINEDGTVTVIANQAAQQNQIPAWLSLDVYVDPLRGNRYVKAAGNTNTHNVQAGDIGFAIPASLQSVSPRAVRTFEIGRGITPLQNPAWHPTLVAGILASDSGSNPPTGPPKYSGLLPAGTVRSYEWNHATIISDYFDAMTHNARISTNSFGWVDDYPFSTGFDPYMSMSQFYDEVVSGRDTFGAPSGLPHRMLVVASVGNEGDHTNFWSTARVVNSAKNVLSVGNVSSFNPNSQVDVLGFPAHDSGRGPTYTGSLSPILSAPGTQMICQGPDTDMTCTDPESGKGITSTLPPDLYGSSSGTSFSTPIVSGAAAQLRHYYESVCNFEPAPQDLRALLVHSAKDLTWAGNLSKVDSDTDYVGPDYIFGYGLLQLNGAMELARKAVTESIETGWVEHRVLVKDNSALIDFNGTPSLKVTLVWDDPAYFSDYGLREDTWTLHNDLDLEVIDPEGNRHLPWVLGGFEEYAGEPATRRSRGPLMYVLDEWRDHSNTIEQVVVTDIPDNLLNRTWTIRVRENRIGLSPQVYTLVSEAFDAIPGTSCGDFANGTTVFDRAPLDVPSTPLAWMLFWIAVIILVWLTLEALFALYEANSARGALIVTLMMLFLVVLLWGAFRLLVLGLPVYFGTLMLLCLVYVLWRATSTP